MEKESYRRYLMNLEGQVFDLPDGTALKLTTSKYYTPKGRNIHGTGLEPDISVALDETTYNQKKSGLTIDNQMERAVEYLLNK